MHLVFVQIHQKQCVLKGVHLGLGFFWCWIVHNDLYFNPALNQKIFSFLDDTDLNPLHVHFSVERSPFLFFLRLRKLNDLSSEG